MAVQAILVTVQGDFGNKGLKAKDNFDMSRQMHVTCLPFVLKERDLYVLQVKAVICFTRVEGNGLGTN